MALFSSSSAYIGLDIGTSSLKVVELIDRRRRLEVVTYAQANLSNLLTDVVGDDEDEIRAVAAVVSRMLDSASVSTDQVIAALPSSVVFSTVLTLPDIPEPDMDKAVHFAARDVVPANLDEMVLGWSRVGQPPHMENEKPTTAPPATPVSPSSNLQTVPVFVTAAPKDLVTRYTKLMELLRLELFALEVETFPLVRSLLTNQYDSAMIVDIGDRVTTFHIIDGGTPRVSHTIEHGGRAISANIAQALALSPAAAEQKKVEFGLINQAPPELTIAAMQVVQKILDQAQHLLQLYERKAGRALTKTVLIGGGANLRGLTAVWSEFIGHSVTVGNPWRGLAYPQTLDARLHELGPMYAVAVGLAQRGFSKV
ncbi:MAG: pilus assembly protein PilM [Candidatus Andersenbacteria bacterium]